MSVVLGTVHSSTSVLVSIGLPTYNRPEALRKTLESLQQQSYQHFEVIISDNCSPDMAVHNVANEFVESDSRFKFHRHSSNKGATANFQWVLEQAKGELFMWCADDDYRHPGFIAALVDQLALNPSAIMAFCDFREQHENGSFHSGYSRHLQGLNRFVGQGVSCRLLRFMVQNESKGKANLIYSLFRKEVLKDFNWSGFVEDNGSPFSDVLIVYSLLNKGGLVIDQRMLYQCTVGNLKYYSEIDSIGAKAIILKSLMYFRFWWRYVAITPGVLKLFALMIVPFKFFQFLVGFVNR